MVHTKASSCAYSTFLDPTLWQWVIFDFRVGHADEKYDGLPRLGYMLDKA